MMGYFKDEHMILTCWEKEPLEKIRLFVLDTIEAELGEDDYLLDYSQYLPAVMSALANGTYAFFIPADGSKEGWETSNMMDNVREKLTREIIRHNAREIDKIEMLKVTVDEYDKFPRAEWVVKA